MTPAGDGWGTFAARLVVTAGVVLGAAFVGVRWAQADPGGRTRDALTVAGALSGVPVTPTPTLDFVLRKAGAECRVRATGVSYDGVRFSAELPLTSGVCGGFFDGADVVIDVEVNGSRVVTGGAVNPVPYARYADQVGVPDCPVGYERTIDPGEGFPADSEKRLCIRRRADRTAADQVVRVGAGASAFWIDRYEAGI